MEEESAGGWEADHKSLLSEMEWITPAMGQRKAKRDNVERMLLNSSEQVTPNNTEPVTSST